MESETILEGLLPGRLRLGRGGPGDYAALERFHYRPGRPATWAGVWGVWYEDFGFPICDSGIEISDSGFQIQNRLVALGVLSYPTAVARGRQAHFGLRNWPYGRQLRWANAHLRTISRVIVHPQFRGIGLAGRLVRRMLHDCPTRYVEALAVMGHAHPFFEKAGMTRVEAPGAREGDAVYYVHDQGEK